MRILLIEDNKTLSDFIADALGQQGYTVDVCQEGDDGLRWLREGVHDLVLLDRMLPRLDGLSVLQAARRAGIVTPVLMLTALGTMPQVVEGLDSGADDYIVKPFALEELLARVRALVRRPRGIAGPGCVEWGGLRLNLEEKKLYNQESCCSLSKRECDMLALLLRNPGKTLSRASIFTYVWGPDAPVEEANLDNYIHFIRQRLKEVGGSAVIVTVRGIGYRLERSNVS